MAKGRLENLVKERNQEFGTEEYKTITVEDYFIEYLFPDAIIYGMSYDDFWYKDPELFFSYRFSYFKKLEIDQKKINYEAWLKGFYNYEAHLMSLAKAFGAKGAKNIDYPSKPHDLDSLNSSKENKEEKFLQTRNFWSRFKERRQKQ